MHSWIIPSSQGVCFSTAKVFEDGEVFYTALFPLEKEGGYRREDYSSERWRRKKKEEEISWQSVYRKTEKKKLKGNEERLRKLLESEKEEDQKLAFLFGVFLERKKTLRYLGTQEADEHLLQVYEHKDTQEIWLIPHWQITPEESKVISPALAPLFREIFY